MMPPPIKLTWFAKTDCQNSGENFNIYKAGSCRWVLFTWGWWFFGSILMEAAKGMAAILWGWKIYENPKRQVQNRSRMKQVSLQYKHLSGSQTLMAPVLLILIYINGPFVWSFDTILVAKFVHQLRVGRALRSFNGALMTVWIISVLWVLVLTVVFAIALQKVVLPWHSCPLQRAWWIFGQWLTCCFRLNTLQWQWPRGISYLQETPIHDPSLFTAGGHPKESSCFAAVESLYCATYPPLIIGLTWQP